MNPSQASPVKDGGLEIIGAGFGRTGTLSLKVALEELGFGPCYHMEDCLTNKGHAATWQKAINGEKVDWPKVLHGYRSTSGWPSATVWKDLLAAYPKARVILTERDSITWYESVYNALFTKRAGGGGALSPPLQLLLPAGLAFVERLVWRRTFDGAFQEEGSAVAMYGWHTTCVKHDAPPGRLLVFNVKDGWEPLCAFLQKEVPQKPFPHANAGEESFLSKIGAADAKHSGANVFLLALVIALAAIAFSILFQKP
eukprot:jgi/Mesen1/4076/ME000213S03100